MIIDYNDGSVTYAGLPAAARHAIQALTPSPTDTLERIVTRNIELRAFLLRLLDPEDLGHAVTDEVREKVRQLLTPLR